MRDAVHLFLGCSRYVTSVLLCGAALSCGGDDGDAADSLVAAANGTGEALCDCAEELDFSCTANPGRSACVADVLRAHSNALDEYVDCIVSEMRATTACIERASCDTDRISSCIVGATAFERCGVPNGLEDTIEAEVDDTCPSSIDCEDGESASGDYCDGVEDCRDGSDELGCSSGPREPQGVLPPPGAPPGSFPGSVPCSVPADFRCDGISDCADGTDELGCPLATPPAIPQPPGAPMGELLVFTCTDGTEVPFGYVCDGEPDCADGGDEAACFTCASTARPIRQSLVCDGIRDCTLGDDEAMALCLVDEPAGFTALDCGNGETVSLASQICDGFDNCSKGDDEVDCFDCADAVGRLRGPLVCDGIPDCADASDEASCDGAAPADPFEACAAAVAGHGVYDATCGRCACATRAALVSACDAECWTTLECIETECAATDGGLPAVTCVTNECGSNFDALIAASDLAAALPESCPTECRMIATGFEPTP